VGALPAPLKQQQQQQQQQQRAAEMRILIFVLLRSSFAAHLIQMLIDDYGWFNAGWHSPSNPEVHTPEMDALVRAGVELDRAYAFKYCSPSRCALQSGRNPLQVNVVNDDGPEHNPKDPIGGWVRIASLKPPAKQTRTDTLNPRPLHPLLYPTQTDGPRAELHDDRDKTEKSWIFHAPSRQVRARGLPTLPLRPTLLPPPPPSRCQVGRGPGHARPHAAGPRLRHLLDILYARKRCKFQREPPRAPKAHAPKK